MKDKLKEDDLVVIILHDHGSRYVGKLFNDDWMRERGFLKKKSCTAIDLIEDHKYESLVTIEEDADITSAIEKMNKYGISQIPVSKNGNFTGSIDDAHIFSELLKNPDLRSMPVKGIMQKSFPFVDPTDTIETISSKINRSNSAVLVRDSSGGIHIITKQDIIAGIK